MKEIKKIRKKIDKIDKKLLEILSQRFSLTRKIGKYKAIFHLPIRDLKREAELFKEREKWAREFHLDQKLVKKIFQLIIKTVCLEHKRLRN